MVLTRDAGGASAHGSFGGCEWHATVFSDVPGHGSAVPSAAENERQSDEDELYVVWCGTVTHLYWLGARNFDDAAAPMADQLIRRLTVNNSNVGVRPETRGVTGIPSMFWVEGYGAQPLSATESAFGLTVTVNIQLVSVEWDFGDSTPIVQGWLGEAWPQRSSVRHTYRNSSGGAPFRVTATLLFQPTYTVNGTPGPALAPIQVPTTRDYVVHQIQAERTS
jgi:hypothetical protein